MNPKKVKFVYCDGKSSSVIEMSEGNVKQLLEQLRSDVLYTSISKNNTTVINMRNVLYIEIEK